MLVFSYVLYMLINYYIYYWFIYLVLFRGYGLKKDFKVLFYWNFDLFSYKIVFFLLKVWNLYYDMYFVWFYDLYINYNGKILYWN